MKKDGVLGVTTSQPTPSNATARGRCMPAGLVASRMPLCAARRAASGGSVMPCTRAWTSGETRRAAGTRTAGCQRRRSPAPGGLHSVPSFDGAIMGRWFAAGLYLDFRAASSGAGLAGASGRPACGAPDGAPVGVQPTTLYGPRPSGPGKAAASSRIALPLRRAASSVQAKRVLTTLAMPRPARSPSLIAGTTAGQRAYAPGDRRAALGVSTRPSRTTRSVASNPFGRRQQAAPRVFHSGRNRCSRPASTPRDSHPQVQATNTYPSGRCEHA